MYECTHIYLFLFIICICLFLDFCSQQFDNISTTTIQQFAHVILISISPAYVCVCERGLFWHPKV